MGISLITALTIQNNEVICDAGGPSKENGKYCGWIMMDVDRWHPLLNTETIYTTADDAKKAMLSIVSEIKKADLSREIDQISKIIDGKN